MYKNRVKVSLETLSRSHKGVRYMITNRVIGGSFIFGDVEKQKFLDLMFEGRERHSYRLLDYVLMDNHYHCVIEIDPIEEMSRVEVIKRWNLTRRTKTPREPSEDEFEVFCHKIHDVSFVVGNFEQRFVQWYNKRMRRNGSLFNRFDSVIIEDGRGLAFIMAYITMNPVRAGLVADPAEFHWCGYAYRLARGKLDRHDVKLVRSLFRSLQLPQQILKLPVKKQLALLWKYFRLRLLRCSPKEGCYKKDTREISRTLGEKIEKEGGRIELDRARHFLLKVRFASKGIAIGSELFVENVLSSCGRVLAYKKVHHAKDYHIWDHIYTLKKHRLVFS